MKTPTLTELKTRYQEMSQEEFESINIQDLTDVARIAYADEVERRGSPEWKIEQARKNSLDIVENLDELKKVKKPSIVGLIIGGLFILISLVNISLVKGPIYLLTLLILFIPGVMIIVRSLRPPLTFWRALAVILGGMFVGLIPMSLLYAVPQRLASNLFLGAVGIYLLIVGFKKSKSKVEQPTRKPKPIENKTKTDIIDKLIEGNFNKFSNIHLVMALSQAVQQKFKDNPPEMVAAVMLAMTDKNRNDLVERPEGIYLSRKCADRISSYEVWLAENGEIIVTKKMIEGQLDKPDKDSEKFLAKYLPKARNLGRINSIQYAMGLAQTFNLNIDNFLINDKEKNIAVWEKAYAGDDSDITSNSLKRTMDYSDKIKKCLNCNTEIPDDKLKCPNCGSDHFIWE